jgi:hypothetical protein
MSAPSCPYEPDVLDLVATGQWPERADAALRTHVAGCALCTELAVVAVALGDLADATHRDTHVPDASVVWYRAQLRARDELARRAARPLMIVYTLAALALAGATAAAWTAGRAWLTAAWTVGSDWARSALSAPGVLGWDSASSPVRWMGVMALAWIVLIPLAFYVATLADRSPRPHRRG